MRCAGFSVGVWKVPPGETKDGVNAAEDQAKPAASHGLERWHILCSNATQAVKTRETGTAGGCHDTTDPHSSSNRRMPLERAGVPSQSDVG